VIVLGAYQLLIASSTWLLTYALHSLVACGAALAVGRLMIRSPRFRNALYRAALVLPLVTATIVTLGVRPVTPITEINVADLARRQSPTGPSEVFVKQRVERRGGAAPRIEAFATDSIALKIAFGATAIALLTALLGLLRLVHRYYAFRARLGERRDVAFRGRASATYRLTVSPTLGAPVALGFGEICVPDSFQGLGPDEQESVLAHEAAHLARRDPFWFALSDAIVALFPWQPLVRFLCREARRTAEFCCDDVVMERVGHGRALVRSLATFAAGMDPAETAFAASCGGSPLEERARRLLGPRTGLRRTGRWALGLALLGLAAIVSAAPAVSTRSKPERLQPHGPMRRILIEEVNTNR